MRWVRFEMIGMSITSNQLSRDHSISWSQQSLQQLDCLQTLLQKSFILIFANLYLQATAQRFSCLCRHLLLVIFLYFFVVNAWMVQINKVVNSPHTQRIVLIIDSLMYDCRLQLTIIEQNREKFSVICHVYNMHLPWEYVTSGEACYYVIYISSWLYQNYWLQDNC